ncbi:MAG: carboxymuconolactone decarboxylase family protein [Firmicutes bacterium HGW-Firmicutes-10]|jgi:AhpD family alkylhydroperoxidase|nr:MAG: carboxymuconolactone decarboxylase family protein [Firmicutes bacterium HGW-Firmicutes-10]
MHTSQLKKKYSMKQLFGAFVNGYRSLPILIKNRKSKRVDLQWMERLMLATTEVNGCEVCSYAHAKIALKEGLTQQEIQAFLSGSDVFVNEEESVSIFYAQHVADSMGNPDADTYIRLSQVYGAEISEIIHAGVMVMMMGNISGIPLSAFIRRLQGKAYSNSSLVYELSMLLIQPFFMIVAIPIAWVSSLAHRSI